MNGYGNVDPQGFVAYASILEEGAWKAISIKKYDSEDLLAPSPLAQAPLAVVWKLHATWAIRALVKSMNVGNNAELDTEWDAAQRSFDAAVLSEENHEDPAHRAAAARIRTALLTGAGTKQTQFELDAEYEFGKTQLRLAAEPQLAADLTLTGLDAKIDRVRKTTEALGAGIGRGPGKNRAPARSLRIRDAVQECVATFNHIHDGLVRAIAHTPSGPDRDQLEELLSPFQALLDRHPAPAKADSSAGAAPAADPKDPADGKTP